MRTEEFKTFTAYLTGVIETLGHKITANQIMMYFEVLRDEFENINEFKRASIGLMKNWNYSYMPKPAHFIESLNPKMDIEIISQKAWESVMICLENGVGSTKTAEFDDNLIPLIIENYLGGFSRLGRMDYKELDFKKKEFLKIYENLTKKREAVKKVEIITLIDRPTKLKVIADYPTLKTEKDNLIANNTQHLISKMVANTKF